MPEIEQEVDQLAEVAKLLETQMVKDLAEAFHKLKVSFGGIPPEKWINIFHAAIIVERNSVINPDFEKVPEGMAETFDRVTANGMAIGYLLATEVSKEGTNVN